MTDHDRISNESAARLRLVVRAFEIADAAMIVAAQCYGVPNGEEGYGMADGNGREVRTVAEAGEEMREAVEWLTARKLATLSSDKRGDVLTLALLGRAPDRPGELVPLAGGGSVDFAGNWRMPK